MNSKCKFLIVAASLAAALLTSAGLLAAQASPYERAQQAADEAYQEADYGKAYRGYLELAKKGDSFSQYRVSYMNFQGQGVDQDWNEAFAWALLAAQGNNPDLVQYLAGLTRELPEEYATSATERASSHMDRWGIVALAEKAAKAAKRELRSCTGSRLGKRCEEVYAMRMPRFWDIGFSHSPFHGDQSVKGSISSSTGNGIGGPVLNTRYYQSMRWGVRDIEQYIMNNATNVQIGDLETVEN
jgi:hypothetical protein